jgi:hypothetical protein
MIGLEFRIWRLPDKDQEYEVAIPACHGFHLQSRGNNVLRIAHSMGETLPQEGVYWTLGSGECLGLDILSDRVAPTSFWERCPGRMDAVVEIVFWA